MIKAILIDDEQPALNEMSYLLKAYPVQIIGMIQDARDALEEIAAKRPDAVFLDIEMPGIDGLTLALKIQELNFGIRIIFVTAYSDYALKAFQAFPLDYLMKPVDEERFSLTMKHLSEQLVARHADSVSPPKTVIRCFGEFRMYSEGGEKRHAKFATRQVKELLAYLISRFEKPVSRQELIEKIFGGAEDHKTVNQLHVALYRLRNTLEEIGASRGSITILKDHTLEVADGVCDYIDFVRLTDRLVCVDEENIAAAECAAALYTGDYLGSEDYEWADETRAEMEIRYEKLLLRIAAFYSSAHKERKCEKVLLTLLKTNPLSEEGNNALLDLYMRTGDATGFIRQYEDFERSLLEELSERPEQKYTDYYEKCRRNEFVNI